MSASLRAVPPRAVVEVLLLVSLQPVLLALRWQQIIAMLGADLSFRQALKLMFVGVFFNQVLPTSVGGDALRFWGACRRGIDRLIAAGSVLIDRASGLVTVSILIAGALAVIGGRFADDTLRPLLFALAPCGVIALVLAAFSDHLAARWLPPSFAPVVTALAAGLRRITGSVQGNARLFVLGALVWLPLFVAVSVLASNLGIDLDLSGAIVVVGGSVIVTALPISIGGWGVREITMVALFGAIGVPAEPAFLISVLMGAAAIVVSLPGGLLWLTIRRQPPTAAAAAPEP